MFEKLLGMVRSEPAASALAVVRNVTIGRTVVLDPLAWRRMSGGSFRLDRDTLEITAQGLIKLDTGGYVHRFYTDDEIMLQAVSSDPAGQFADDFTIFTPYASHYPASDADKRVWIERLSGPSFTDPGLPVFQRYWFPPEDGLQPPVTFWEEVFDDRAAVTPYSRIYQSCMLYSRDRGEEGGELLLAIAMEPQGGDYSHEVMVGVALGMAEFTA
ncbi:MAG: hypothetical protein JWO33_1193 [Caulobacteraceae bacterium]|nr:hypothetical protein [Caulobacteraceae bacterium]